MDTRAPGFRNRSRRSALAVAAAAALTLAPSLAAAQDTPGLRGIRITDDGGRLVALGDLDDGRLDVEAVRDGSGFGTMVVYLEGGETLTLDATLDPTSGEIVVFGSEFDESLAEYAARYGLDVTVAWDDSVEEDDWDVGDVGPVGNDDSDDDRDVDGDDAADDLDGDDQDDGGDEDRGDERDDDDQDDVSDDEARDDAAGDDDSDDGGVAGDDGDDDGDDDGSGDDDGDDDHDSDDDYDDA